jgi:hypothetical protein
VLSFTDRRRWAHAGWLRAVRARARHMRPVARRRQYVLAVACDVRPVGGCVCACPTVALAPPLFPTRPFTGAPTPPVPSHRQLARPARARPALPPRRSSPPRPPPPPAESSSRASRLLQHRTATAPPGSPTPSHHISVCHHATCDQSSHHRPGRAHVNATCGPWRGAVDAHVAPLWSSTNQTAQKRPPPHTTTRELTHASNAFGCVPVGRCALVKLRSVGEPAHK